MLFRPRATAVDTDVPFGGSEMGSDSDFSFAFDNSNFSDRLLKIEIVRDLPTDANGWTTIGDWARNRKRRREEFKKENVVRDFMQREEEEQLVNCDMLDTDYGVAYENQEEEAMTMVEESPSDVRLNFNQDGDEAAQSSNSSWNIGGSTILRVKMIHISSPILAAKSPFFYKLFSNETKESENRLVTLRIHASEEAAFLDLLRFIYGNTLSATCPTALLDVLLVADKFEVASCMRHCSILLRSCSMTCESALLYLDLPYSVLMAKEVLPLADTAKQFLGAHYKDISKFQEEVLNLPLAGIEAVLSNDDLLVASEDVVCEFVLKWARVHYHNLEERQEVLSARLAHLIRFPFMSCRKLKKVLACSDFDPELASKLVLEALFFKAETPYRQSCLAVEAANAKTTNRHFVERAYKYRPIKVVEFEHPCQQRIVFLELKREECARLFPAGRVYSQAFHFGGQVFFLSAHCNMDQQSSFHCFGLFLGMQERKSVTLSVDYEFSARVKPTEEYVSKYKGNYTFTGGKAVGYRNLFGIPWTALMADDNLYFINGILHLRAELTVKQ